MLCLKSIKSTMKQILLNPYGQVWEIEGIREIKEIGGNRENKGNDHQ
jgi:hypothetical protein